MEDASVEDSDAHTVDTKEISQQYVVAVSHDTIANFGHRVAAVFKVAFKQEDFAEVLNWIILTKHLVRDLLFSRFDAEVTNLRLLGCD